MQMFQMLYGLARFGIDMDKQQMSCFFGCILVRESGYMNLEPPTKIDGSICTLYEHQQELYLAMLARD